MGSIASGRPTARRTSTSAAGSAPSRTPITARFIVAAIRKAIADIEAAKTYSRPVVTEVVPFKKFWPAEEYHQNYVQQNPGAGYVRNVSKPRIEDFKAKQPELLK